MYSRLIRTRAARRRVAAGLVAGLGALGLVAGPTLASASSPTRAAGKLTPVQQGLKFYRGKSVTIIEPGATGAIFDLIARTEANYLGQYLHANVTVEDMPAGNTIAGQDATANASPDGLTLGLLNLGNDAGLALSHAAGLNFNPTRLEFIAASGSATSLLIASTSSPYHTFSDLLHATNPVMLMENSGSADNQIASLYGLLGIHPKYITGYTSIGTYVAGFQRGDGPIMYTNIASTGPLVASGKAVVLAASSVPPVGTLYRQYTLPPTPTFATLLAKAPTKTAKERNEAAAVNALIASGSIPLVTQTSVAGYKLATLRAAAIWMFKQPGFKTAMLGEGQNPTYIAPVTAKTQYITLLKYGALLLPYIAPFGL